jgi:hypothetical protein
MKRKDPALEAYRRQLNDWVAAMAVADNEAVTDTADGFTANDVHLFTEGNLDKRADILSIQLSFLRHAFEDLDDLIGEYVMTCPQEAFTAGPADAAAMLRWLLESYEVTPEQEDHIACRLGRYAVEDTARDDRRAHLRFQERLSVARRLANDLGRNDRLRVYLNPALGWAKLQTRVLVDDETHLPADVAFFAVKTEIHSAVLDDPVPSLLAILQDEEGLTLDEWAARSGLGAGEELVALTRRLAELGLVALA